MKHRKKLINANVRHCYFCKKVIDFYERRKHKFTVVAPLVLNRRQLIGAP